MYPRVLLFRLFALCAAVALSTTGIAQDTPKQHFKVEKPAKLTPAEALEAYERALEAMGTGYGAADYPPAKAFLKWRRYNKAPYLSATHGNRYVNSYANVVAKSYGNHKPGRVLPVGSILAKDSFTVTGDRKLFPGALFVMEKLAAGASADTADWRYVMVLPDGSLFGDSSGDNPEHMQFCHGCHAQVAEYDYVFFVPSKYRAQ